MASKTDLYMVQNTKTGNWEEFQNTDEITEYAVQNAGSVGLVRHVDWENQLEVKQVIVGLNDSKPKKERHGGNTRPWVPDITTGKRFYYDPNNMEEVNKAKKLKELSDAEKKRKSSQN